MSPVEQAFIAGIVFGGGPQIARETLEKLTPEELRALAEAAVR